MPTYRAKCIKCDHVFEFIASITDDTLPTCPKKTDKEVCGAEVKKIMIENFGGFILKPGGSGGYYKPGGFS